MSTKKDDEKSADDSPNILSKPSSPTLSEKSIAFPVDKPSTSTKKIPEKSKKDKPTIVDRVKPQPSNEKGRSDKPSESIKSSNKSAQSISKAGQSQDEPAPVERKPSRYSERRNKIKEKQISKLENADAASELVPLIDESKQNSGEIDHSEI